MADLFNETKIQRHNVKKIIFSMTGYNFQSTDLETQIKQIPGIQKVKPYATYVEIETNRPMQVGGKVKQIAEAMQRQAIIDQRVLLVTATKNYLSFNANTKTYYVDLSGFGWLNNSSIAQIAGSIQNFRKANCHIEFDEINKKRTPTKRLIIKPTRSATETDIINIVKKVLLHRC